MNEKSPFFSVIILAYKVKKYIKECIESVLAQTFQNYEIILVNPDSSDGTNQICEAYGANNEKVKVLRVENRGQLLNRISGFTIARGEYLLCLDGDDKWCSTLLETVFKAIQKNRVDLIIFGNQRFSGDVIIGRVEHVFPHEMIFKDEDKKMVYKKYIEGRPLNDMWGKVISKNTFNKIKGDFNAFQDIRIFEDLLFNCYATQAADEILYLDYCMYFYRIHNGSITHIFREGELEDFIIVKTRIKKFMSEWHMESRQFYDSFYENLCRYFSDWIYRCAVSELSYRQKKHQYKRLREEPLYLESKFFMNKMKLKSRHRIFIILFKYSDPLLEIYSKCFVLFKKISKKRR